MKRNSVIPHSQPLTICPQANSLHFRLYQTFCCFIHSPNTMSFKHACYAFCTYCSLYLVFPFLPSLLGQLQAWVHTTSSRKPSLVLSGQTYLLHLCPHSISVIVLQSVTGMFPLAHKSPCLIYLPNLHSPTQCLAHTISSINIC